MVLWGFFGTPSNYWVMRNLYIIKRALQIMVIGIGFWVRRHHKIRCINHRNRGTSEMPNIHLKPYELWTVWSILWAILLSKYRCFSWSLFQHIKPISWICCLFFILSWFKQTNNVPACFVNSRFYLTICIEINIKNTKW